MKNLLIIIFCLWLVGCETPKEKTERHEKEYPELVLNTISLGGGMYRVENAEVICYQYYTDSIQCKFK